MNAKHDTSPIILVVEDEQDIRRMMKESLHASGYKVLTAEDERDAVERTASQHRRPDLVLIDSPAPSSDTLAAGRRIRREARLSDDVPVVVIAGEYRMEFEDEYIRVGEHDFVSYETNFVRLKDFIGRLVYRHR